MLGIVITMAEIESGAGLGRLPRLSSPQISGTCFPNFVVSAQGLEPWTY